MSVINKMLQDLDRQDGVGRTQRRSPEMCMNGVVAAAVNSSDSRSIRHPLSGPFALILAIIAAAVVGTTGVWWYSNQRETTPPKTTEIQIEGLAPASAPASAPLSLPASTTEPQENSVGTSLFLKMDHEARAPIAAAPRSKSSSIGARPTSAEVPDPPSTTKAPAGTAPAPTTLRLSPTAETLAQAQQLWRSGAHEAGMELLREASVIAERSLFAGTLAGGSTALASLVRELSRMELSEGRANETLARLTRLEPALPDQADIWAIRGNAAQRLGRHQESVSAYQMALKLNPDEPRWMLAQAVSLAALGQTAAAAELAEKARDGGALNREVAGYLRQLGVPLSER